jgi:O-antigen biosynthesis protein
MFKPIRVLDLELSRPIVPIEGLTGYGALQALVRLHGAPIGYVTLPLRDDRCLASSLTEAILDQHSEAIIRHIVCDTLAMPVQPGGLHITDLLHLPHPVFRGPFPAITVAVCTRDRTDDLACCLDSLCKLDYPLLDLVVVDNAPASDNTERLVHTQYPNVRYVREPRPGLDWARNRAIREAHGQIIAFTDDDVVVDPGWLSALAAVFAEYPEVMLVTGLVVPYELETEAQMLFERYGGFGRGFERKWVRVAHEAGEQFKYYGTGQFGTGANMAYRCSVFEQIGDFDPALDVGTVTNGGGDLEMFFRALKAGHTLVYEPSAIVRHRHRRDYKQLQEQIFYNGVALNAYFIRSALAYPDERRAFLRFWFWWLGWRYLRGLCWPISPGIRKLLLTELRGFLTSQGRYHKARRIAASIAGDLSPFVSATKLSSGGLQHPNRKDYEARAVRIVDLCERVRTLTDVQEYSWVHLVVMWQGRPLGTMGIKNCGQQVTASRIRREIASRLNWKVLEPDHPMSAKSVLTKVKTALGKPDAPIEEQMDSTRFRQLPIEMSVSIVLATRDRPDDLRNCLHGLIAQVTPRRIEIVVVDNNPTSGMTAPVIAEFPNVRLINETRQGLAYARNAGFSASTGDIVLTTDDDVSVPADWVEKLVAPFNRADVMIVTGNVLPLELETRAQLIFEMYGGLGRGFRRKEVDGRWFESARWSAVPTWTLGCTANAAFRASIFTHPAIGLMDEALGPGMPSGVGEDIYLYYKVLKAGYSLIYEPQAYVWHKHRRDLPALRRQVFAYSKGHVAYHLTTLIRDHDLRALLQMGLRLPMIHLQRIKARLRGWSKYPFSFLILEIAGNLVGPWALWRSHLRVKREGRSHPCIRVSNHSGSPP